MDAPVTERQFLEQVHELSHKIKFAKEQSFHDAIACQDVQQVLERLRMKVRETFGFFFFSSFPNKFTICFN